VSGEIDSLVHIDTAAWRPQEGRLSERDAWLFVAADRELPVGSCDNWAGG
jgi:hypothetical protein